MRNSLFILAFCLFQLNASGQAYRTAIGIRLSPQAGISVQQALYNDWTVEGLAQSHLFDNEFLLRGLLEKHFPLASRRLNIYAGLGLHKGWYYGNDAERRDPFGLSSIVGAEFTIGRFNASYDFQPIVNFQGGRWIDVQTGLSLRYVLFERPKAKINWRFWEK